jgi:nucleoside-diphosphate-sugar epimerase
MSQMKKILVTGGAGAIGSNLVKALLQQPDVEITVIDNLSSGLITNVADGVNFLEGDISDHHLVNEVMGSSFCEIYHLAGFFANQNSCEHPIDDFRTNALGTVLLLDAATRQTELQTFLFTSTSSIESDLKTGLSKGFSTPYMTSKYVGELYSRYYQQIEKLPVRVIRYFNCYGPGEYPGKYRNVIINFISRALKGKSLVITGDGSETRDFTFVDDIVSGTIAVARSPKTIGFIYNIGTGVETRILDLATKINRLTGNKAPLKFLPRRSWDKTLRRNADITLAREHVGYSPTVDLETGLKKTIEWYKSKTNG